jgi:DNA polymerase type B, organellar and viral
MTRRWADDPRNPNSPNFDPSRKAADNDRRKASPKQRSWADDPRNPASSRYNPALAQSDRERPRTRQSRSGYPFGTIDGEGGNIDDPALLFGKTHEYLVLRADEFQIENPAGLDHRQSFDFLASLPNNRIWSGFFFDYDVTMMCKSLPEERARRLFDPTLRLRQGTEFSYATIDVDDLWEIGYTPHKEFKVRRKGQNYFTTVSDTGTFFQTSFVNTLRKWKIGTDEELDQIIAGKSMRADFEELTQETKEYNELECRLHNQLMEEFRSVCGEVGYLPKKWQGPGHLASAMLAKHGVPKREDIPIMQNRRFRDLANAAYYGGRAETTAIGHIPGPIYQWDINGAYVYALQTLPCLLHGSWKLVHDRPARGSIWVGNVEFGHDGGRLIYNLPVRKEDGNIFFPRFGSGHYWSTELEAAERAGTSFIFKEGWVYEKHCNCSAFDWIPGYYAERLRLGKSGKGMVLKLGGNSIYGKIAQSIGYAPWANPVWAGLITAWCRATIINAYRDNPDDVLMIMTDGIFMRHRPKLRESNQLGDWELKVHDHLFIVQPGIYFLPESVKTRGVPLGRIEAVQDVFRERFEEFSRTLQVPEPVPIPVTNFVTMRQALARRKWRIAGTWESGTRDISYDWTNKRQGSGLIRERDSGVLRTLPQDSSVAVFSKPYDRIIGGNLSISPFERFSDPGLIERVNESEQPDWVQPLIGDFE